MIGALKLRRVDDAGAHRVEEDSREFDAGQDLVLLDLEHRLLVNLEGVSDEKRLDDAPGSDKFAGSAEGHRLEAQQACVLSIPSVTNRRAGVKRHHKLHEKLRRVQKKLCCHCEFSDTSMIPT
jgi:hypothetical protein